MDGIENSDLGKEKKQRTLDVISMKRLPGNLIPELLQLLPCQPNDGGQGSQTLFRSRTRQKGKSGTDDRPEVTECRDPPHGWSDWLHLGNFSMDNMENSMSPISTPPTVRSADDDGVTGEHSVMEADYRLLYVKPNPTARFTYGELMDHYNVPSFALTLAGYISKTGGKKSDPKVTINNIVRKLQSKIFPVWDYVRFLTKAARIERGQSTLGVDPREDIVYCEPTVKKYKSHKGLNAAIVLNSTGMKGIEVYYMCLVRMIFALPLGFCNGILPKSLKVSQIIPSRLAFVEWYQTAQSSEKKIFEFSPMMGIDNQPFCGIVPVTAIRGSVKLSRGTGNFNTYLTSVENVEAIIRRKCNFDLRRRTHQTFLT